MIVEFILGNFEWGEAWLLENPFLFTPFKKYAFIQKLFCRLNLFRKIDDFLKHRRLLFSGQGFGQAVRSR